MAKSNPIDEAFEIFESEYSENRKIRREAIAALQAQIPKLNIDVENDKAMKIQAKMMVVKTLDDLLKSDEDVSLRKLKMKLARKDSETNGEVGTTLISLLKSIRVAGEKVDGPKDVKTDKEIQDELEAKAKELKLEVTEGEVEACGASPVEGTVDEKKDPPKKEE